MRADIAGNTTSKVSGLPHPRPFTVADNTVSTPFSDEPFSKAGFCSSSQEFETCPKATSTTASVHPLFASTSRLIRQAETCDSTNSSNGCNSSSLTFYGRAPSRGVAGPERPVTDCYDDKFPFLPSVGTWLLLPPLVQDKCSSIVPTGAANIGIGPAYDSAELLMQAMLTVQQQALERRARAGLPFQNYWLPDFRTNQDWRSIAAVNAEMCGFWQMRMTLIEAFSAE